MRTVLPALLLVALGVPPVHAGLDATGPSDDAEIRLARYTTAAPHSDPHALSPLATVVHITLPRDVTQVGEALRYLLLRTGYALGDLDAQALELLALPLPQNHRQLGPAPIRDLLEVLVGVPYLVAEDAVRRRVSVRLDPALLEPPAPADAAVAVAHPLSPKGPLESGPLDDPESDDE